MQIEPLFTGVLYIIPIKKNLDFLSVLFGVSEIILLIYDHWLLGQQ